MLGHSPPYTIYDCRSDPSPLVGKRRASALVVGIHLVIPRWVGLVNELCNKLPIDFEILRKGLHDLTIWPSGTTQNLGTLRVKIPQICTDWEQKLQY